MFKIFGSFLFILCINNVAYSQTLIVHKGSYAEALLLIEEQTNWIFNYDPEQISNLELLEDITIELTDKDIAIKKLLKNTALLYEIDNDVIILLPPELNRYRICGKVLSVDRGEGLDYAHVYIDRHSGVWTDENGSFEFNKVAYKNESLRVSYLGYRDTAISVSAFTDGCVDLRLTRDPFLISEEIIVRDYLISSIYRGESYNGINMNMRNVYNEIGAIERDVLKTAQLIPGITSLDERSSDLIMRGGDPDQHLVIWEGAPMYDSGHMFGMISAINPFTADHVKIYKGVYSAAYENRIGGLVDVSLSSDLPDKFGLGVGTTLTESHAEVDIPLIKDKLGLLFSGRKSITNFSDDNPTYTSYGEKVFQSSNILESEDENEGSDPESDILLDFYDVNAKLIYKLNDKLSIESSFFRSDNKFNYQYEYLNLDIFGFDSLQIMSQIFSNQIKCQWNPKSETIVRVNRSTYQNEYTYALNGRNDNTSADRKISYNHIDDIQLKFLHGYSARQYKWDIGYIYDQKKVEYSLTGSSQFEEDVDASAIQDVKFHHLFVNTQYKRNKWIFDLGVRGSYLSSASSFHFLPRIQVAHKVNTHVNINWSAGVFNQYVKQIQNYSQSQLNIENRFWVQRI